MNQENLWAPWRMAYIRELGRKAEQLESGAVPDSDFFSRYWREPENDVANHVIHRNDHGMVLLNRYPYANGHLLVALGDPRPTLLDYTSDQRAALWSLVDFAMLLMQRAVNPQGVNIGINEGSAAGAGVPEHLHAHLVPRRADTNFITTVGQVRIVPEALEAMAAQYREALAELPS